MFRKSHRGFAGHLWLLGVLLVAATVLTYRPAWHAGFIWDDDRYVTDNAMLTAPDGLRQIWLSTHRQSQYFPLVYTTLRIERSLWGLSPTGYHVVNIVIHALNALLVWTLLRRLLVPGAWLAAAIFALHPVQVESVAWITELKNTQSTAFCLLSLLAWVEFAIVRTRPAWGFYALAAGLYGLALLSKTTACTLPAAMLLVLWWRHESIGWKRIAEIVPFVVMGVVMGFVSVWWEWHLGNYDDRAAGVTFGVLDRTLIATRAIWFYVFKLLVPVQLAFIYPRWNIDPAAPLQYAGLLAIAPVAVVLARYRDVVDRGVIVGVLFFVATLSPLLGFIPLYTFRYSFVADHYQYFASLGIIAVFAGSVFHWAARWKAPRFLLDGVMGTLLLTLAALTWQRCEVYRDAEALWRDTLRVNPNGWMVHNNLAIAVFGQGKVSEAIRHYERALELGGDSHEVHNNLGNALAAQKRVGEAISHYEKALDLRPAYAPTHNNLAAALTNQGKLDEAIAHLERALALTPDYAEAHNNLGVALASKGRLDEAIGHYERALELKPDYAEALGGLGLALTTQGQVAEGQRQLRRASSVATAQGKIALAAAMRARLTSSDGAMPGPLGNE